jgi:drug/metabolite transporter (DMT)-like permease
MSASQQGHSRLGSYRTASLGTARPAPPVKWYERFAVSIVFTVFVVFRAADRAFLYRVQKYLKDSTYNLILSNIIWPVAIQLMTIAMLLAYICMLRWQGHKDYSWRFFLPGNPQASSMGPVPLWRLALFSFGDQLNAAISAPPSPFISLPLASIMTNLVIVWMLPIAAVWLGTRFKQVHFIGCSLIILAVVVGVADKLEADNCSPEGLDKGECLTSYKGSTGHWEILKGSSMALWYGLFVLSTVPSAVSNCYKQKVLKGVDLDVMYATWWSGNFQVLWGILLFWVLWIPLPEQKDLAPGGTLQAIADTWQCFNGNIPPGGDTSCAAEGGPAIKWFIIYLCFNLTFNVCLLWLTKRMSAMWAQIATTLCLDLTNIFSQYQFIVGASAALMTLSQWLATVLASIALWTYNLEPEILPGGGRERADSIDTTETKEYRARSFGASMVSDGRAGLVESFSFQKTSDPPVALLRKRLDSAEGPTSMVTSFARQVTASLRGPDADTCEVVNAGF